MKVACSPERRHSCRIAARVSTTSSAARCASRACRVISNWLGPYSSSSERTGRSRSVSPRCSVRTSVVVAVEALLVQELPAAGERDRDAVGARLAEDVELQLHADGQLEPARGEPAQLVAQQAAGAERHRPAVGEVHVGQQPPGVRAPRAAPGTSSGRAPARRRPRRRTRRPRGRCRPRRPARRCGPTVSLSSSDDGTVIPERSAAGDRLAGDRLAVQHPVLVGEPDAHQLDAELVHDPAQLRGRGVLRRRPTARGGPRSPPGRRRASGARRSRRPPRRPGARPRYRYAPAAQGDRGRRSRSRSRHACSQPSAGAIVSTATGPVSAPAAARRRSAGRGSRVRPRTRRSRAGAGAGSR